MTERRILVSGRVQGVGYRAGCRRAAQALGLSGSVRNLGDGRVEVRACGPAGALDQLVAWCRVGPGGAEVTDLVVTELPAGPPERPGAAVRFQVLA